jgi:threonine/homoserine/homoserine lactone efflux protein
MAGIGTILAVLFVLSLWGMSALLEQLAMTFTLGQWILYVVWLLWTFFGAALTVSFAREGEPRPVRISLLLFGGPSLISGAILASLWF